MAENDANVDERKEKIKAWLKDPSNLLIILITLFAFILHLYYLNIYSGQTLWWDEAEYMATAKHWALDIPYTLNPQRPPLFQLSAAFLIRAGLDEFALKFLLIVLPATALIYFTYLLGKELFDKKTGLFAALASAGMWSYLFWGARFQPDFLSVAFQVLSLFFFWKMFKYPNTKDAVLGGVFAALGFYFKISALLVPISVFLFALWKERLVKYSILPVVIVILGYLSKQYFNHSVILASIIFLIILYFYRIDIIKNKIYWQSFLAFLITLIPFMLWQYVVFSHPLEFAKSYGVEGGSTDRPLGWQALDFFTQFPKELFFVLFCVGVLAALFYLGLRFDLLLKENEKRTDPRIFSLIVLLVVALFYIFYIKGVIEDRWVFLITPFVFILAAQGVFALFSLFKVHKKEIKIGILIVLFAIFFYVQLSQSSDLIKCKSQSYAPVKDAALWIKEHSSPADKVVSASYTQMTAYAEREVLIFAPCAYVCSPYKDDLTFDQSLREKHPRYLMFSLFEGHPAWAFQQQEQNGIKAFIIPYLNSSIAFNQQGQVVGVDLKPDVQREDLKFTLVYPQNQFNGVFVYEIQYS